jgi:hypothetical protein
MQKIWYIVSDGKRLGPFSIAELRSIPWLTPDTLLWREGCKEPIPARHIQELKDLFEDLEPLNPDEDEDEENLIKKQLRKAAGSDELAIDFGGGIPPHLFFYLILAIAVLLMVLMLGLFKG